MSADVIIYNQMYNVTLKFVNLVSLWVKVKYVQRWYVKKKKKQNKELRYGHTWQQILTSAYLH